MATSSATKPGSVVGGALIIIAIGVMLGGAHSWRVQSGDNPVQLRVDTSNNLGFTLGPKDNTPTDEVVDDGSGQTDGPRTLDYEIGTDDAYAVWESGLATFVDARLPEEYEEGHIPFARFLNYEHLYDTPFPAVIDELLQDTTQPIVFYCTGGDCDSSHNAAAYFQQLGFTTVHVYLDGYPGWVEGGYEIETGPDPMSME